MGNLPLKHTNKYLQIKTQQLIIMYPYFPNKCLAEMFDIAEATIESNASRFRLKKLPRVKYTPLSNSRVRRKDVTNEIIKYFRDNGYTVRETIERLGITRNTYYRRLQGNSKFD